MSSVNSSSVPSESARRVGVWTWASMEMWDRSKSGKDALTWRKQSLKPSTKEPPNSFIRVLESQYSFIATSLAWRSYFFNLKISSSLSLSIFLSTFVCFSDSPRSLSAKASYFHGPPSKPSAPLTPPLSSPLLSSDDPPPSPETGNDPLNPSSWAPPAKIKNES